jgi:hypothetical protein
MGLNFENNYKLFVHRRSATDHDFDGVLQSTLVKPETGLSMEFDRSMFHNKNKFYKK